jgi:hypothetical protein
VIASEASAWSQQHGSAGAGGRAQDDTPAHAFQALRGLHVHILVRVTGAGVS